jgi:hypothetical protein
MTATKEEICTLLDAWIRQRPGLEFGNYGDVKIYRSELRSITKDLHDARELLRYVAIRDSISAKHMTEGFRAFSGRLSLTERKGKPVLEYCTGQYWPTEYRRAACAVLAAAIWDWQRENMPKGELVHNSETGDTFERYEGLTGGDWLRRSFRREFGKRMQSRWFD